MKIRFYKIFVLGLTILISNYFSGCSKDKCTQQPDETFLMKASDKTQIMYTGHDTLKFLHNGTDTIIFVGHGVQQYFDVQSGTGGDCPGPNQRRDEYTIKYTSTMYNSTILYTYGIPLNAQSGTQLNISFEQGGFYNELVSIRAPWAFSSLQIASKLYSNIALFASTVYTSDSLYYNSQYGILRMSFKYNTSKWEIIK